jgi:hypothetical protein
MFKKHLREITEEAFLLCSFWRVIKNKSKRPCAFFQPNPVLSSIISLRWNIYVLAIPLHALVNSSWICHLLSFFHDIDHSALCPECAISSFLSCCSFFHLLPPILSLLSGKLKATLLGLLNVTGESQLNMWTVSQNLGMLGNSLKCP